MSNELTKQMLNVDARNPNAITAMSTPAEILESHERYLSSLRAGQSARQVSQSDDRTCKLKRGESVIIGDEHLTLVGVDGTNAILRVSACSGFHRVDRNGRVRTTKQEKTSLHDDNGSV